jgi:hypothetical protein
MYKTIWMAVLAVVLGLAVPATTHAADAPATKASKKKKPKPKPKPTPPARAEPRQPDARPVQPAKPRPTPEARKAVPRPVPDRQAPERQAPVRIRPDTPPAAQGTRLPSQSHSEVTRGQLRTDKRPIGATRPYDKETDRNRPPHRTADHRYARPSSKHLRHHPHAHHPPPQHHYYRHHYAHWWVHPYWRHRHSTVVVVGFPFYVHAWAAWWTPPHRHGWRWVSGYWSHGHWHPGHWRPVRPAPVVVKVRYVYVPGWWQGDLYVDGHWRRAERPKWVWTDGYYLADGTYASGYWRPTGPAPDGYVWEPGLFDGEDWVEGFWRPRFYTGYAWISAHYDDAGVYHMGYWEPLSDKPEHVWIPGWFDGQEWVVGYWVTEAEYKGADPTSWKAEEGWNAGWDEADAPAEDAPLALPVDID